MKLRLHCIGAALIISLNCLYPQDHLSGHIVRFLDDLALSYSDDIPSADYATELTLLSEDPVNINSADINEIKRLFFLTVFQVHSIVDYTKRHGDILSAMEISFIPGFDKELAGLILPFISFSRSSRAMVPGKRYHLKLIANYVKRQKDENINFTGSPYKFLTRLKISSGPLEAYLISDKDSGEPLFLPGHKPDFLSGNIAYSPGGKINRLIIGDFKARFGQGLTVWNGFARPPVATDTRPMKESSRIIPYSSSDENDFFRGIAISSTIGNINIMSFASMNMIDATIDNEQLSGEPFIRSFYNTGIHNTPLTTIKKNRVTESSLGFNINRMQNNLYYGFSTVYSRFSLPVIPDDEPHSTYDFRGKTNASFAVDYAWLFTDSYLFGEFAVCNKGKTAFLQGLSLNPEGRVRCNFLYSRVNRGYNSFHGNASGRKTFNKYSSTALVNITAEPAPGLLLAGGAIRSRQLWYNNISGNFPSSMTYLLSLRSNLPGNISISSDLRYRISDRPDEPRQGVRRSATLKKTGLRLTVEVLPTESFTLRSRIEKVFIGGSSDSGILCYQTARYTFRQLPLEICCRLMVFNTGSYDSRIYAWEDDLLYNPLIRALYNQGNRSYIMIICKPVNIVTFRIKYAVSDIVRGADTGITDEFKMQMVMSF